LGVLHSQPILAVPDLEIQEHVNPVHTLHGFRQRWRCRAVPRTESLGGGKADCPKRRLRSAFVEYRSLMTVSTVPWMSAMHPDRMTAPERLDEIARILALGLIRLRLPKSSRLSANRGECSLDFPPHQSGRDGVATRTESAR
jgi:hypothetical protein